MSLINFLPLVVDDFAPEKPFRLLNRDADFSDMTSGCDEDEDENCIRFSLDLPGVKASDLEVTLKGKYLLINGARRMRTANGCNTKKAKFQRVLTLDVGKADVTNMKANLADGVLTIHVPKTSKPEPINIKVSTNTHEDKQGDKTTATKTAEVTKQPEDK